MGDENTFRDDIVLLYNDECSKLYSHYFFSLVFGYPIKFRENVECFTQLGPSDLQTKLLIFSPDAFDDAWLKLIRSAAALSASPFLLCIKGENDPEPTENLFEAGANEVVQLPFTLKELAYRLRARDAEIGLSFDFEPEQAQTLDIAADVVHRGELTDIEAQVMLVLMERGGQIVSRDTLSLAIDNKPWSYGNRKFDVHVARIRKKLDSAYGNGLTLRTVRSAGYQLTVSKQS